MLKQIVNYTDFNGNECSEEFYFNMPRKKLIEMQTNGFMDKIADAQNDKNYAAIYGFIENIILDSYGEKSEDGKRFVQNIQLSEEFEQTAAFEQLIADLSSDGNKMMAFLNGVLPRDIAQEMNKPENQEKIRKEMNKFK